MNKDAEYAEAHRLEGIMLFAEVDALEATQKASIASKRAELAERFDNDKELWYLRSEADKLERFARYHEDAAQDAYDAWAAYCAKHEL